MLALAKKIALADRMIRRERGAGPHAAAEQRAARQDARHRRRRADRQPPGRAVRAVRDDRARLRPVPLRRRGRGARCDARSSSTSCSNDPTSCTSTARSRRETEGLIGPRAVRAHEADRVLHHDRTRAGARRGRAVRRADEPARSRARASTCSTTSRPIPRHPLLALDTVVASPHTAGITVEATRDIARRHRRAVDHDLRGQGAAPAGQPRGVARVRRPLRRTLRRTSRRGARAVTTVTDDQEREGARAARPSGDRRRRPLGRAVPGLLRLHRRGRRARPTSTRSARATATASTAGTSSPSRSGAGDGCGARRTGACRSTCATAPRPRSPASSTTASTTGASTSRSCSRASGSPSGATSPTPS